MSLSPGWAHLSHGAEHPRPCPHQHPPCMPPAVVVILRHCHLLVVTTIVGSALAGCPSMALLGCVTACRQLNFGLPAQSLPSIQPRRSQPPRHLTWQRGLWCCPGYGKQHTAVPWSCTLCIACFGTLPPGLSGGHVGTLQKAHSLGLGSPCLGRRPPNPRSYAYVIRRRSGV